MLQRLRSRLHGEGGFTLIELLVVILIIGILAAIAIPSFLNQKGKGVDATAKSAARTAATAMETYNTDNNGSYVGAGLTELRAIETSLNDAPTLAVAGVTSSGYTVTVTGGDGRTFSLTKNTDGSTSRTCAVNSAPNRGGCPASGSW